MLGHRAYLLLVKAYPAIIVAFEYAVIIIVVESRTAQMCIYL